MLPTIVVIAPCPMHLPHCCCRRWHVVSPSHCHRRVALLLLLWSCLLSWSRCVGVVVASRCIVVLAASSPCRARCTVNIAASSPCRAPSSPPRCHHVVHCHCHRCMPRGPRSGSSGNWKRRRGDALARMSESCVWESVVHVLYTNQPLQLRETSSTYSTTCIDVMYVGRCLSQRCRRRRGGPWRGHLRG